MKVYFLSSIPCCLTLNGAYFGICDKFERFAEVSLSDNLFAQFTPQGAQPLGCFLSQELRFSPPEGFEVYLLPDGIALYARDFPPHDFALRVHAQTRENDTLVTLFEQGALQLSIQTDADFTVVPIPQDFAHAKIVFLEKLIALKTDTHLSLYTVTGKCVFCEEISDYSITDSILSVTLPLSNALGRYAKCRYTLTETDCTRIDISFLQQRDEDGDTDKQSVANSLLPFAFFESILLGMDYTSFLAESLLEKATFLRAFLGEFVAVSPTSSQNVCALIKRKGERLYEVTHYRVEICNGKIVDVTC